MYFGFCFKLMRDRKILPGFLCQCLKYLLTIITIKVIVVKSGWRWDSSIRHGERVLKYVNNLRVLWHCLMYVHVHMCSKPGLIWWIRWHVWMSEQVLKRLLSSWPSQPMHQYHAWRGLPVNQNPNPAPPNLHPSALHDNTAEYYRRVPYNRLTIYPKR